MDQDFAHMVAASKVPMLKPGEFELWRMMIEQYIQMIDYALWEVIENGATLPKTSMVEGVMTVMPITSAEDKAVTTRFYKELDAEFFRAGAKLIGLQLLQLELRLGKTPSRNHDDSMDHVDRFDYPVPGSESDGDTPVHEIFEESVAKTSEDAIMDTEENIINDDVVNNADQPQDDAVPKIDNAPKNDWFKQPSRSPTPDLEWNKCQVVDDQPEQTWFNDLVSAKKDPLTFHELMATPIDFSKFAKNRLKLDQQKTSTSSHHKVDFKYTL
ncbi:hypothetical protein Tco_0683381 [Tanacetum coccineum]|uniref:Uncharacterized protein n=1 Tax=Tanacetum coccineum TaxID=301880 RepID=A0ABQ4XUH8_9ASTR